MGLTAIITRPIHVFCIAHAVYGFSRSWRADMPESMRPVLLTDRTLNATMNALIYGTPCMVIPIVRTVDRVEIYLRGWDKSQHESAYREGPLNSLCWSTI